MTQFKDLEQFPKLHALAIERAEQFEGNTHPSKSIMTAFTWNQTPEGYDFWNLIYKKRFHDAREMQPELFPNNLISDIPRPALHSTSTHRSRDEQEFKEKMRQRRVAREEKDTFQYSLSEYLQYSLSEYLGPEYYHLYESGFEPEPPKPRVSFLRNDKERKEAMELSDKIFRKRYK